MKLYLKITKMNFEEDNIEHEIIRSVTNREIPYCDYVIELTDDDKFIQDTMRIDYKKDKKGNDINEIELIHFVVREQKTWWNFPLYEIIDGKIVPFDYSQYAYFNNTDRRNALAEKINELYNPPSEAKILRKTLKYIMDTLDIEYPDNFKKYNDKLEAIINKNPKN